jgi:hypothetical protein
LPEIHLVFSDTGTDRLPGWVERFLRAAGGEDETPQSTLEGVQKIDRDLQALRGALVTQLDDLKAGIAANSAAAATISDQTDGVLAAVQAVRDRVAALPGVPPDLTAELDAVLSTTSALNDATTDLDVATTDLDSIAVATPEPPVEPPVEPTP